MFTKAPLSSLLFALLLALLASPSAFGQYNISTVAGGGPNNLTALQSGIGYATSVVRDAAGNTYIADSYSSQILEVSAAGTLSVVAGNGTLGYTGDGGPAAAAALDRPDSIALDSSGNLYIADTGNSVIRIVNTGSQTLSVAGVTIAPGNVQTVAGDGTAGYGGDGGPATGAILNSPYGVFVDGQGNIFIADSDNSAIREVAASTGNIQTVAGTPGTTGYSGDGAAATSATLDLPQGVFVDAAGNIYIADTFNSVIRVVNPGSQPVTIAGVTIPVGDIQTVAGTQYSAGLGSTCQFTGDNGPATSAFLCLPDGVFGDASGSIYIADTSNFGIREVVTAGTISTIAGTLGTAGSSGDGGPATSAQLNYPAGIFVDSTGNVFIADTDNHAIREVAAANITTIAGNSTLAYSGNGNAATSAALNIPYGTFADASGNLYIADTNNSAVREVVAATGIIQNLAGNGVACAVPTTGCGDGGLATGAQLNFPEGVFVDASGNLFIADTESSVIREIVGSTGVIQTVAGTPGSAGYSGDGGAATSAQLSSPSGAVLDATGNIYIADTGNSAVRVVNAGTSAVTIAGVTIQPGTIATVAGNGTACSDTSSGCGDTGPATSAQLNFPNGISLDASGDIFIADTFSNAIREVNASTGVIQTVAGSLGQRGYSGDNGPATSALLDTPYGLFVDSLGNIFVADSDNAVIREVVAVNGKTIQTIAGNGTAGYTGDGGPSASAEFNSPIGVISDTSATVFVTDTENSRVRQLVSTITITIVPQSATVPLGDTQQFAATVSGSTNPSVSWLINNAIGGNSTVGTISSAGLYQAPATLPSSAVTVTAVSNANGSTSASLVITLAGSGTPAISVTSTPPGVTNIYTAATQQFNANVVGETDTAVNWLVNNIAGGNSSIGTIDASGLYTAPTAVPSPALITITAVSQANSSVSGTYPVTIVTAPTATPPASQTISPGSSANYSLSLNANTGSPRQPITLSCVQGSLPPNATCAFTPATIAPSTTAVPFTLTVSVPAGAASIARTRETWFALQIFPALAPLAGMVLLGTRRRMHGKQWFLVAFALLALLALSACGGSSTSNSTNPGNQQNPEIGSYSIKVQGITEAQPNPVLITTVGLTVQ
jgi:sugar lactone lactonase YvrE